VAQLRGEVPPAGRLAAAVQAEFGISQPAASQHLRVLREYGVATVRSEGARRLYAVVTTALREVDAWLDGFRRFWDQRLDALATELARGAWPRSIAAWVEVGGGEWHRRLRRDRCGRRDRAGPGHAGPAVAGAEPRPRRR
jgi:hypothetical protein